MNRMNGVTAAGPVAEDMKEHGRHGDTEMAHVTPGEIVLPHSIQTPQVMQAVEQEFHAQGVPMERYIVQPEGNSENPATGNKEYFLSAVASAVGSAVAGKAADKLLGGGGGGGGGGGVSAVPYPQEANPLPEPVKAVEGHRVNSGLTSVSPYTVGDDGDIEHEQAADPRPEGAVMAQDRGNMHSVTDLAQAAIMSGINNNVTGLPQFFDMKQPSVNEDTGKQEYYDIYLTPDQQKATDWARQQGYLGANEYATGGRLQSALDAAGPQASQAYYKHMQGIPYGSPVPGVAPSPSPARNAPPAPTRPSPPPAQQAAPAPAQDLQIVNFIPDYYKSIPLKHGKFLLSDGSIISTADFTSQYVNPDMNAAAQTFKGANPSAYQTYVGQRLPGSAPKVDIPAANQPDLNKTTTSGGDKPKYSQGQVDSATRWGVSKGYLQPGQTATGGRLASALGSDQEAWREYDSFMNNRAYTPPADLNKTVTNNDNGFRQEWDQFRSDIQSQIDTLGGSDDSSTDTGSTSSTPKNNTLPTFSSLTPERSPRFRSRAGEGSLARNF